MIFLHMYPFLRFVVVSGHLVVLISKTSADDVRAVAPSKHVM